ncbi:MAG: CDP-alcohol phosphatidyltransferase family protein [Chlorobiaceae bacterium]|nr:CDP-alcohol phosphatidyltransferase family protein [Chlorobiaceae bacterium]
MYWISIKDLRAKCQKTNYGYDVYPLLFRFIRVLSIYSTWLLIQTRCNPNTITILGVLCGVLSGIMFFAGFVNSALILVILAVIADFSDGEVSRFHGTTSKEGTYLDTIHHFVVQPFFIAGIVLWSFEKNNSHLFLAAGMVSVINSIILSLAVSSAVDNALLKHLLRYIKSNRVRHIPTEIEETPVKPMQKAGFYRAIPGTVARMLDFPYVIVIMGVGVILDRYCSVLFGINDSVILYMIYLYALLSSGLVTLFVWNVVHSRHIEKRFNETIKMV